MGSNYEVEAIGQSTTLLKRKRSVSSPPVEWRAGAAANIAAAENGGATMWSGIPLHNLFEAKGVAGNIVHVVATTNAIIAGLIVIEAIKVLRGDYKNYRMTYCLEHPTRKLLLMPVESFEPNKSCYVCSETPLLLDVNTKFTKPAL